VFIDKLKDDIGVKRMLKFIGFVGKIIGEFLAGAAGGVALGFVGVFAGTFIAAYYGGGKMGG